MGPGGMAQLLQSTYSSCRGTGSVPNTHIHGDSQPFAVPVPGDPVLSSDLCGFPHSHSACTCIQAHTSTDKNKQINIKTWNMSLKTMCGLQGCDTAVVQHCHRDAALLKQVGTWSLQVSGLQKSPLPHKEGNHFCPL